MGGHSFVINNMVLSFTRFKKPVFGIAAAIPVYFLFVSSLLPIPSFSGPTVLEPYVAGPATGTPADSFGGYTFVPEHVSKVFLPLDPSSRKYHEWNAQTLRELLVCITLENCGPNQRKVALLAAHWFEEAVVRRWRGGEGVWGASMYKHLRAMGYTTFFANSFEEALQIYRMFPDLVKLVIRNQAGECHTDPKCVKGPTNPTGIPAWKIFDFNYFPSPEGRHFHASLLKGKWILSSNPDPKTPSPIQYIGFSTEDECTKNPVVRLADRSHRVWMLMKQLTYLYDAKFSWNRTYFSHASTTEPSLENIQFVGAWEINQHYQWSPEKGIMEDIEDRNQGVVNLISKKDGLWKGKMSPEQFEKEVANSKVMLGMGNPWWSPSPYHALCLGVPFINPIYKWDKKNPWNRDRWESQHPSLQKYDPPFVYNVHARNYTGFVEAIRKASMTEIPSFIPKHMTELAVRERVRILMETDWRKEAESLLEERMKEKEQGGKPYIFEL